MMKTYSRLWYHNIKKVQEDRHNSLAGRWGGFAYPQNEKDIPNRIPVYYRFDTAGKYITGDMTFTSWDSSRGTVENYLVGGFTSDSDLVFFYTKKQNSIIGWGQIVLRLSHDGRKLEGHVTGISSHTENQFHSIVELVRHKRVSFQSFGVSKKPVIFIGHGKNEAWKHLKRFLMKKGYTVETYESGRRAGRTIVDVLDDMMAGSSFAFLIMTGDDKTDAGNLRARQNVIHEIGLFQGKLGFPKAVVLLEDGVEDFSNIRGIQHIPFKRGKIDGVLQEALGTIRREFPPGAR
jgi:hypothetical protein